MAIKTEQATETRTYTYEKTVELACDLCGRLAKAPHSDRSPWSGPGDHFEIVRCLLKKGTSYPEGTNLVLTGFDVCPDCWASRVVPWFESQGAKPRQTRRDY